MADRAEQVGKRRRTHLGPAQRSLGIADELAASRRDENAQHAGSTVQSAACVHAQLSQKCHAQSHTDENSEGVTPSASSMSGVSYWVVCVDRHRDVYTEVCDEGDTQDSSLCPRDQPIRDVCVRLRVPWDEYFFLLVVSKDAMQRDPEALLRYVKYVVRDRDNVVLLVPDKPGHAVWEWANGEAGRDRYFYGPDVDMFDRRQNVGYWAMKIVSAEDRRHDVLQRDPHQDTKSSKRRKRRRELAEALKQQEMVDCAGEKDVDQEQDE